MRTLSLSAILLLAAGAASAQFEGVAEFKTTVHAGERESMLGTTKMFVTKSAYRMESETDLSASQGRKSGGKGAAPPSIKTTMVSKLADPDRLYIINDEQKSYSVMDLKKLREDVAEMKDKEAYSVQKLGGDTVAGLSCQRALLTSSKGSEIEVCMTKEIVAPSQWISHMNRRQRESGSWMKALKDSGVEGFPIRWSVRKKGTQETLMTMELARLERRSLPASLFEVPAGYKETQSAMGGLTPEQRSRMNEALEKMTPEQRKAYEDAMRRYGARPTPKP